MASISVRCARASRLCDGEYCDRQQENIHEIEGESLIEQKVIPADIEELNKHIEAGWSIKSTTDKMAVLERVKGPQAVPELEAADIVSAISPFDEPSEDEILYYSSPYYDVLMARKADRQQQLELEKQNHG